MDELKAMIEIFDSKANAILGLSAAMYRRNQLAESRMVWQHCAEIYATANHTEGVKDAQAKVQKMTEAIAEIDQRCEKLLTGIETFLTKLGSSDGDAPEDPEWPSNLM